MNKEDRLEIWRSIWHRTTAIVRKGGLILVNSLDEARQFAEDHGYEGMYIVLKTNEEIVDEQLRRRKRHGRTHHTVLA